jgi:hypothetical protein
MWKRPVPGDQLPVPAQQRGWGDEERRPPLSWQQPGQGRQHDPILRLQIRAVHLPAQHRHLMPQNQQLHVLGAAVAGQLRQHLQELTQDNVGQRGCHGPDRRGYRRPSLAQIRTSQDRTGFTSPTRC